MPERKRVYDNDVFPYRGTFPIQYLNTSSVGKMKKTTKQIHQTCDCVVWMGFFLQCINQFKKSSDQMIFVLLQCTSWPKRQKSPLQVRLSPLCPSPSARRLVQFSHCTSPVFVLVRLSPSEANKHVTAWNFHTFLMEFPLFYLLLMVMVCDEIRKSGKLGPGAQLSALKKWQIGPRTVGPQKCTIPKTDKR